MADEPTDVSAVCGCVFRLVGAAGRERVKICAVHLFVPKSDDQENVDYAKLETRAAAEALIDRIEIDWQNKVSRALYKVITETLKNQETILDQEGPDGQVIKGQKGTWTGNIELLWPDTDALRALAKAEK